jgi:hypothetical protein
MISTDSKRVQIQNVVEHQLPSFVREDFPLITDFLKQYYISQEYPGASVDLIQNIDQYLKLESLTNNSESTELSSAVSFFDDTINVKFDLTKNIFGTYQFPEKYGLIQIDDEIILYTEKTNNSFIGCIRGFSGVTSYTNISSTDSLTFSVSEIAEHEKDTKVINLSSLLLKEFLTKIKYQFTPGFEERQFDSDVNQRLFISRAKDFYQTKGTDESFKILFGALYGEKVEVIKPRDYLFRPSDAQYRVTKDLVVEPISGNPLELLNSTLFQDRYPEYNISNAYASVTNVEKLFYGGKEYYQLSVDFDYSKDITFDGSVFGNFSVHPKTKVITTVSVGSSIVDVDSTVGFPKSGELVVKYSSGETGIVSYSSKTLSQFVGISSLTQSITSSEDIRLNVYAYGYVGLGTASKIDVRIGSVLSELVVDDSTYYFSKNDTAQIKSLGITTSGPQVDSWIYNLATKYDVESITLSDSSNFTYKVKTYVKNNFNLGDFLILTDSTSSSKTCYVNDITDAFTFSITNQGSISTSGLKFTIQKILSKPRVSSNLSKYSYITNYVSNVQNTYSKFNHDVLVASSSLPTYYNQPLNFYDRKITLNGIYSGETFTVNVPDHGYYTGDAVYYKPFIKSSDVDGSTVTTTSKFSSMQEGVYYVKRLGSPDQFKLATSQANLYNGNYVSVSGIVTSNTIEPVDFYNKNIQHQNLLKEIKKPNDESGDYVTEPGRTGILINGVEILNYKSDDTIYYGAIESIAVSSKGKNYDVINPPILSISDRVGTGATGICAVKGSFNQIDILDSGFDYLSKPIVTITGGNGTGAKAEVNTKFVEHSVSFNATLESAFVNIANNTIGFSTYHKFRNAEKVVYKTDGQQGISGIVTNSVYFVRTIDASTIKLYRNEGDAISGFNTVSLNSYGVGVHRIQSFDKKQIISNIVIVDSGQNYENKKRTATSAGIKTASNEINIINHDYNTGDIVQYSYDTSPILGINSLTSYIVTKVDNDNFKLSSVGVGSTAKLFYFNNKQYVDLKTTGSGNHIFNYEPITVSVIGEIGVSTFSGQDFSAKIQPIVRGGIESVQVTSSGVGYGVTDILNYNRQPIFTLSSGSSAELLPIVNNGRIVEVLVTNEGSGYNSPPEIVVSGTGKYAKLIPVIKDGKIKSVKIDSPGVGYSEKTKISIISSGSEASFSADIQKWTVNLFQKYLNIISDDDGILSPSSNEEFDIQYTHLYAPRKLRESIYGKNQDNQVQYGVYDLQKINGEETTSGLHSPIIGWAYDGNPIYGPYGFSEKSGSGTFRAMKSGYISVTKPNRPPYTQGFFVEDYEFNGSGDLDEHNGRFCITPDFPNGVYAYFATINPDRVENSSTFNKYKIPVFPYFIGNSFKSKPNSFNYTNNYNQISYDLNNSSWFRNTSAYNLTESRAYYDFLFQPNKIKSQTININEVTKGGIDSVGIVTGGTGYKVNDKIIFGGNEFSQKAKAKISSIKGKSIVNISVASTTVSELEIIPYDSSGSYVAFSTSPHGLKNNDLISLSGINTSISHLQNTFNIGVRTERLILNTGVGTVGVTGIVTYFNVSGNLNLNVFSIRENDIISIENEKVKVLNVDVLNSRIRVLRSQENTVSSAHTASTILYENPRKFTFKSLPENEVVFEINKEIYFNPKESLGVGTIGGVGIGTTIFFSNPGAGLTQIFIPTQSIYIPKHNLNTGDILTYHNNGGSSILISNANGITTTLSDISTLYVGKISNDLIGISTYKVGLGSTGTFVGIASTISNTSLMYFVGVGTGVYHSFKTQKEKVVAGEANKNYVTVSTAATHGLSLNDEVQVYVKSGITTVITVKYDDYNRRIVFNPKSFVSGNVDILTNTITILYHGFNSGDKVIHTSTSPCGGLNNEEIYYIFRFTKDKVKLCRNRYQTLEFNPEVIDITTSSLGTLSLINPPLKVYKNNVVKFDLSDSSLSSLSGSTPYSAFDINLYTDSQFKNVFDSSKISSSFEVSKIGQIGISTDASLTLRVSDSIPENLYYKFSPINSQFVSQNKKEIYIDTEVSNANQIQVVNSLYEGTFNISGIGSTTFVYNLKQTPERSSYDSNGVDIRYTTNSISADGGIESISITYPGSGYLNVAGVSTIVSLNGSGSILEPSSKSIGQIASNQIEDIGFDFPTDKTLRPVCNLPEILLIEPLSSFDNIGITSSGKNYSIAPKLIVVDGYTGKVVDDVDLTYKVGDTKVKILKNTFGIYNVTPKLIPTNNQNGIGIRNITFNNTTKEVSVGLNTGFSDSFPFSVGDKVLIENVSVNQNASIGIGTTGKGYNSSNYGYSLFTLTKVPSGASALGGSVGVVTYSLSDYLKEGEIPGNYDSINSSGRIIAEKDFPIFDVKLKKNNFILGETVFSNENTGQVESWNNQIELLKVSSAKDFKVGDVLVGQTSKTQGTIKSKVDINSEIKLEPTSIVKKGWSKNTGFLNYNTERISDNNYYQNFSYSLKSKISLEQWQDSVSALNHTAGFLKFSDLIIESNDENYKGVYSDFRGGSVDIVVDIYDEISLNCYTDFDLVTENALTLESEIVSDEIYFNSKVLTDYYESFGNRVLIIDDISTQFNSNPRSTRYSIVDLFPINHTSKKYFTYVRDKRYSGERQFLIVALLQNGSRGYLSQYGRVESQLDLGSFDFSVSGTEGQLLFYPTKYAVNNYNVSFASFDILSAVAGIGSTTLGDVVTINSSRVSTSAGVTTTIVSTASTYRSSKIILQINGNNGELQYDELNVLHDGTNVDLLDYGQITNHSADSFSSSGLGTYNAYISGGKVNVDFSPNVGIAATVNAITVSIASTLSTGIGTQYLGFDSENIAFLDSSFTAISSSPTPTENIIARYSDAAADDHNCSYFVVSVEDTTNNRYEMSEVIVLNDSTTAYITEYGNLITHSGLGTVGAAVSSSYVNLYYTPIPNIDVQVRVFQTSLQLIDIEGVSSTEINLNNAIISAGYGFYQGTEADIKRAFNLQHKGRNIFVRDFNGSSSSVVDISNDTILIPEHFFVTGEELEYSYDTLTANPIGIASTSFVGVGTTSLLPASVFVIKVNEQKIKLARSAEDALKTIPISLDITSVGVGTYHTFTAKNQNSKCIIALDNYLQSPIVSTSVTTGLTTHIGLIDDIIRFSGITSFFSGDLIKINDEIMKINTVGLGSTNYILVDRPWMGTGLSTHSEYSVVTKVQGNYNIIDNTINFITAPQGPVPIGSTTNPPDERDWTGITTFSKFQGRSFLRSAPENSAEETYNKNYIFDDISEYFNATQKTFTLKSDKQNITGFSTNNSVILINGIFQGPTGQLSTPQDYSLSEASGITSITFTGAATSVAYDPNNASIPIGGIIVSVGSTSGFGYQPLVAAGGTAVVSAAGTISSISIGNSGSGYRVGIQTTVRVGVTTLSTGIPTIQFIGTAAISGGHIVSVAITNPGTGYTSTNPPTVLFDSPLSYSNIPLIYSSSSPSGFGTQATIDIVVGQGSSVIDFEIKNPGYNYGQNQILTIASGGFAGIPTDTSKTFKEFQITIDKTISDEFSGWNLGELEVLDKIESRFDGIRKAFTISKNSSPLTIRAAKGSNIDIQATLLVFLNDILQVPGEGYTFTGGSTITFAEAPRGDSSDGSDSGDKCKILFYKGSGDIDVIFRDVLETVKTGDTLTIADQEERLVTDVISSDTVETNPYSGENISANPTNQRTVEWCKQTSDKIINGQIISKSRTLNEALVNPSTYIIQSVGIGSTIVYVESVRSFFDSVKENQTTINKQKIIIVSQDSIVGASATAIVSVGGTISSVVINNGGVGYTTSPNVIIGNPVGMGTTQRASASATISIGGSVSSITMTLPGTGYTVTNPPQVLVEIPETVYEINTSASYTGDFGQIVGVSTTSVGVASTGIIFDFYIPTSSVLRDTSIVSSAATISGIQTGYYFVIKNSNVGTGVTSLYQNGSVLGIATQFLDGIYEVASVSIAQTSVPGIALTYVARVTTSVSNYGSLSGIGYSSFFGEYSWGRIELGTRSNPQRFNSYLDNGATGISSAAIVNRITPLKYLDYF